MFKTHEQRLENTSNPLLKKLFKLMIEKKSNLCVAANFRTFDEILEFVDQVGHHIVILKTQILRTLFHGLDESRLEQLSEKKKKYGFLIFEDQKYGDIAETVSSLYEVLVNYIDIVTVNPCTFGDAVFEAIEKVVQDANLDHDEPRGCLAVCEPSSKFDWLWPDYPERMLKIAERHPEICIGIIAQKLQISDDRNMIKASPGVHLTDQSDGRAQQWSHPSEKIKNGSDIIIVGRGIVAKPKEELERVTCMYKEVAYQAYLDALQKSVY